MPDPNSQPTAPEPADPPPEEATTDPHPHSEDGLSGALATLRDALEENTVEVARKAAREATKDSVSEKDIQEVISGLRSEWRRDIKSYLTEQEYASRLAERTGKPVVNVKTAGADPTGETPVDGLVADLAARDRVLYFPPGTYRVGSLDLSAAGVELRGFNTTLLPEARTTEDICWLDVRGTGTVIDGFEIQYGHCPDEGTIAPVTRLWADSWQYSNIVLRGDTGVRHLPDKMTKGKNGVSLLSVSVNSRNGVGKMENVYALCGTPPNVRDNRRLMFVKNDRQAVSRGRLEINRLWAEHFCENTVYGDYPVGTIHLDECYIRNSPIGIRIPGGSSVTNTTIIKDGPVPWQRASLWEHYGSSKPGSNRMRGVWLVGGRNSNNAHLPTHIHNCDFIFTDDSDGAMGQPIVASPPSEMTRITQCRFLLEADRWPCIQLDQKGQYSQAPDAHFSIRDVQIRSTSPAPALNFGRGVTFHSCYGVVDAPKKVNDLAERVEPYLVDGTPDPPDPSPPMPTPPPEGTTPNARQMNP